MQYKNKGFTLIELLVVIAIIAALAVLVFAAVDPGKRIRDAQRQSRLQNATTILDAYHTYLVDNAGIAPTVLNSAGYNTSTNSMPETEIGSGIASVCGGSSVGTSGTVSHITGGCAQTTATCLNLAVAGSTGIASYLAANPIDTNMPSGSGTATATGYTMGISGGIVTVKSCNSANSSNGGTNISVAR